MKQRLAPTVAHLSIDLREVGVVLHAGVAYVERSEPALVESCRYQPVLIAARKKADVVWYANRFKALQFDPVVPAGDQVLQLAFGSAISGPKPLIGMKKDAGHEMAVEASRHKARVRDQSVV